jgi:hypothetical protein
VWGALLCRPAALLYMTVVRRGREITRELRGKKGRGGACGYRFRTPFALLTVAFPDCLGVGEA